MRIAISSLLALALTTALPGPLLAGKSARPRVVRKAPPDRGRPAAPARGMTGQSLRPVAAPDPMAVTVQRDRRGRVANRGEVEVAARALMTRRPSEPGERRATWRQLIELADGTRFRADVVRAAFRLTTRSEHSEFGMYFTNAPRGRGLPADVHREIYGYKPMPRALEKAIDIVAWPFAAALLVLGGGE